MWDTIHKVYLEVTSTFLSAILWLIHGEEAVDRALNILGIKEYIKRRKADRRQSMNFVSGLLLAESEAVKVSSFIQKLPTYLPLIQQNLADLQKAATDKSNPEALMMDVSSLLTDLNNDLAVLATVAPALKPTIPTPAASIAQTPPAA